jgi:hypothetical protein
LETLLVEYFKVGLLAQVGGSANVLFPYDSVKVVSPYVPFLLACNYSCWCALLSGEMGTTSTSDESEKIVGLLALARAKKHTSIDDTSQPESYIHISNVSRRPAAGD